MKTIAWKPILITFAVSFVLGAIFGRWEFSQRMHDKWKDPYARQRWVLKRLDAGLNLNHEQEMKIAEILNESAVQMEAVRAKIYPEKDALRQRVRQQVMPLLTPEQQKKYDQMEMGWQEHKAKQHKKFI